MTADRLIELASLLVFTFGALAFSILTVFYWGDRRRRGTKGTSTVFPWFTLVCAAAFLNSLLSQLTLIRGLGSILIRDLTAGLLPPLILHLTSESGAGLSAWRTVSACSVDTRVDVPRWTLYAFYTVGIVSMLARALDEAGLVLAPSGDILYLAPALLLAVAAAAGLLLQALSIQPLQPAERSHRRWTRALLVLMALCAAASLAGYGALIGPVPDYLLLAFFSVYLYYRERLLFFDLLVKRGAFVVAGLVLLTISFAAGARSALALLPCWLLAPWIYSRVSRAIDRAWLRRPFSQTEAERQFTRHLQAASTEDDLRACATAGLHDIFQTTAEVCFDGSPQAVSDDGSLAVELEQHGTRLGCIVFAARPNGIPFLSDDRNLALSLAAATGVVLENVRLRAERRQQEEREQQLRWLASRAELKALRAQINPHFLFNTLSVIAGLVHYRPELADETIEQLGQVFRYTLRKSESEWAPLAEEVEFVSAYLRIEQARFGERLSVEIDIQPAAALVLIPAMSVQPLIENAVKHGVSAMEGCGKVGLRATILGECLSLEVFDNGPGFPPGFTLQSTGEGHGLRNVADRLRGYYGDGAQLSWNCDARGTRVVLTMPQTGADRDTRSDR